MADNIDSIIRGLTKPQRHILIHIGDGRPREYVLGHAGYALISRKLAFINELGARHLTDLGHVVRTRLTNDGRS